MAIQFSCKCTYKFALPDEEAGGLIQCPKCGLLNDIPLHQDLASITEDGTYKLDSAPVLDNPETAAELIYVYTRGARDVYGDDKDMRISDDELSEVRGETIPINEEVRTNVPKYDPETGEIIDEFELTARSQLGEGVNPGDIPIAKATLNYAVGMARHDPSMVRGFVHLFTPPNLAVMLIIFFIHVLLWPLQFVVSAGIFFLGIGIPPVLATIASHYGNVIEEMGPLDKDDLPRPLRDMEFFADIWWPFCNLFGSLLICYWPLMPLSIGLATTEGPQHVALMLICAIVGGLGTFLFPAVLLTLVGSGTPVNLRPDRVFKTISQCGASYFYVTVVWISAAVTYTWGFAGSGIAIAGAMNWIPNLKWYYRWIVVTPMLIVAIVLMHYFSVCVAMLYRVHHREFPWVLQQHVRTTKPVVAPASRPKRKPRAPMAKPR